MEARYFSLSLVMLGMAVVGAWVCLRALLRWQAKVLLRERGENPEGFPVLPPQRPEDER